MSLFNRHKNVILEEAIKVEKQKLAENKILAIEKGIEFHKKIKPMAGDVLGGYVDIILKQRAKLRDV